MRVINPSARIYHTQRSNVELGKILDVGAFDLERAMETIRTSSSMAMKTMSAAPIAIITTMITTIIITITTTTMTMITAMTTIMINEHGHDHHHAAPSAIHDVTVQSISLRGGEMNPKKFFPWIEKITQVQGPNILRLKGIIAFDQDDERYVVQGVHMIIEGNHQRPWKEGEKRESRLVFIGRELDRKKIEESFKPVRPPDAHSRAA